MRGYAICTEPRSGSTHLCDILMSTGLLGRPEEYFNLLAFKYRGFPDYPADPEGQLQQIPRLSTTPNGVYGLKLNTAHFDQVASTKWAARLPSLSFVYLQRLDLLGQAISHVKAVQSGQWTSLHGAQGEPVYDRGQINNELVRLARAETRWRFYFARNGVRPLRLAYEDILADPQGAVDAVAQLVGLQETAKIDPSRLRYGVQRDDQNQAWRARFLAESHDLSTFH